MGIRDAFAVLAVLVVTSVAPAANAALANAGPSFDCKGKLNESQKIICGDETLSALDRKLGAIFNSGAQTLPAGKVIAYFVAEQQDWMRSRDGCPTTRNPTSCLSSVYRTRIAELQGRFHLVTTRGPFRFACEGDPRQEIVVTWYETDPPSGLLETRQGQTTVFSMPSGSGTRYVGDNVALAEHQGVLTVVFGTSARELTCTQKQ